MTHHDRSAIRRTSVTIRTSNRALLREASKSMRNRGVNFSEQRLMRECLRVTLKFWRGHKDRAARNKRYNYRTGPYEIAPFYTTEALRSVAWTRCHQAGISLSRVIDFAVRFYLPRVMEYWLRYAYRDQDRADAELWAARYQQRLHRDDFVISYEHRVVQNTETTLEFWEKTEIRPWPPPKTEMG